MKNAYVTSHFPLISICLFSLGFSMYAEQVVSSYLQELGLYAGMVEFFSAQEITLTLMIVLWLFCFMLFAALKLIADTVNEVSLLFFSREGQGTEIQQVRAGTWIFLTASIIAVIGWIYDPWVSIGAFLSACAIYFIYFLYKVSDSMGAFSLIGMVLFHLFFWAAFLTGTSYVLLRLYAALTASLPI
ncbi:DUF5366 family protein [Alkalicoccus urumqiensis]|uniref:YufK family protein n=1 Tax=Alkalicoccus urumqiensis TaxID=1548213 RepID=A0A2P6MEM0_ALKUR|nr:DUF5366 family protein [Alkalicoccus urumqiensis]PRO64726.1 hypothetical protein C6I21_13555 [Alkalicoccus urumqiensis]